MKQRWRKNRVTNKINKAFDMRLNLYVDLCLFCFREWVCVCMLRHKQKSDQQKCFHSTTTTTTATALRFLIIFWYLSNDLFFRKRNEIPTAVNATRWERTRYTKRANIKKYFYFIRFGVKDDGEEREKMNASPTWV